MLVSVLQRNKTNRCIFKLVNIKRIIIKNWLMRLWRLKSLKQWPQDWKRSVFIPVPKKGNAKECSTTAAAAKLLQSCPTLCDPIDGSPPGSPVPGILQARTLEWVAVSFSNAQKWKVKVKSLSCVRPSATPWTAAFQAPPSMGFSRQEYCSRVPLPSPKNAQTTAQLHSSQTLVK